MRTRSIILLALAMGCGLVAAIGISQYLESRHAGSDEGQRQPVFVAMVDVRPNEELTAQNIKVEEWPQKIIPPGALSRLEDVEGKRSRVKIYAGEPILTSKLLGAEDLAGAASDIPAGYRVVPVKVDPVTGSTNLIQPGDRVDLVVFRHPHNNPNATAAKIVLQDIKVFAVDTHTETKFTAMRDEHTEPMTAKTISLLLKPEQVSVLHTATQAGGAVQLSLRNPADDEHVPDRGVTLGDVFGVDQRKADRDSERATQTETSDLTSWLNEQQAQPAPLTPPKPAENKRMLVLMGAELVSIEIPAAGGLPIIQIESGPADLGGAADTGGSASGSMGTGGGFAVPPGGTEDVDDDYGDIGKPPGDPEDSSSH